MSLHPHREQTPMFFALIFVFYFNLREPEHHSHALCSVKLNWRCVWFTNMTFRFLKWPISPAKVHTSRNTSLSSPEMHYYIQWVWIQLYSCRTLCVFFSDNHTCCEHIWWHFSWSSSPVTGGGFYLDFDWIYYFLIFIVGCFSQFSLTFKLSPFTINTKLIRTLGWELKPIYNGAS